MNLPKYLNVESCHVFKKKLVRTEQLSVVQILPSAMLQRTGLDHFDWTFCWSHSQKMSTNFSLRNFWLEPLQSAPIWGHCLKVTSLTCLIPGLQNAPGIIGLNALSNDVFPNRPVSLNHFHSIPQASMTLSPKWLWLQKQFHLFINVNEFYDWFSLVSIY